MVLFTAARWRIMAIRGTTPEPPPISNNGLGSEPSQVKYPPIGPRNSILSPERNSSAR
jgi:hypothetical protein